MMRRICVFGATGGTGSAIVQVAVERRIEAVAFVRNEAAKFPQSVIVVAGNLLDRSDVERAIAGSDAIVCAFAPRPSSPDIFCAQATQNIIDAMKAQGVRRLLCVTGAMIGNYAHLSWFMRWMKSTYQKQQPALARDRAEQEQCVEVSGLDWTLVKPPRLTDGKARGRVRSGEALKVGAMSSISRADLAHFILDQVDPREYVGKRVVVQH